MVLPLTYRRPSHVSSSSESVSSDGKKKSIDESINSGTSAWSSGIPAALSFDRIVAGGVCPPLTLRDFMNYLKYIEHSAENLQFYLWFRSYRKRFDNLPETEKALSPPWVPNHAEPEPASKFNVNRKKVDPAIAEVFEGTDFGTNTKIKQAALSPAIGRDDFDPFSDGSSTACSDGEKLEFESHYSPSYKEPRSLVGPIAHGAKAQEAFADSGFQWAPFSAQPFHQEISRIIAIYLAVDSPRQLNLSERERASVLRGLQHTTHPSAMRAALAEVEYSLRRQAHPNFVRWSICNGNRPRVIFARGLGVFTIIAGLIASILITLSNAGRGYRVIPIVGFIIGIATLIAAWKGMCVVLHGLHHAHIRPWELFGDDESIYIESDSISLPSLTSEQSNSYEDEPWVAKYEHRNVVRKVFDREIWIQEPALRQIQDTIFIQSIIAAFLLSAILTGIFCALPHGNFY